MRKFLMLTLGCLIFLSSCVFIRPSPEKLYRRAVAKQPYDVAIVPGSPYDGKEWTRTMKGRVLWAVYLYKKGIVKNIIFSGAATYTPYVEAKVMALYAESLGVPRQNIFIEDIAEHSTENVYYSYHLAKKLGFTKLAVATDPFQYRMLMGFSNRRFKLPIDQIPFVVDSLATIDDVNPLIDASNARVNNFRSIVDKQSRIYRFRGTAGLNIKFEKE
jgi:vancomycin permeability regulator SanA